MGTEGPLLSWGIRLGVEAPLPSALLGGNGQICRAKGGGGGAPYPARSVAAGPFPPGKPAPSSSGLGSYLQRSKGREGVRAPGSPGRTPEIQRGKSAELARAFFPSAQAALTLRLTQKGRGALLTPLPPHTHTRHHFWVCFYSGGLRGVRCEQRPS